MTYEEKLNLALSHLSKNQVGSFLYYKEMPEKVFHDTERNYKETPTIEKDNADRNSRLIKILHSNRIPEKEHLPILDQLIRDNYIDATYEDGKPKDLGHYPQQIKITYSGMIFNVNGGYKPTTIIRRYKDGLLVLLGAGVGAVITGLVTLGVEYLKPTQPNTRIKFETYKCDSLKVSKDSVTISAR